MTQLEIQAEALQRARSCRSLGNILTVVSQFSARGIPKEEILPGENVLTYNAWRALGRTVRRGEHGVKVATVRTVDKHNTSVETGEETSSSYRIPWSATVFHVSQTDPLQ
jgi:antirestriction protein ArdC